MMKAIIKKVEKGKLKGQFVFILKGDNNKTIAISESYTRKYNCMKTLDKYFPDFLIPYGGYSLKTRH